jgi:nucleotide-binding universal stress UspA family protein
MDQRILVPFDSSGLGTLALDRAFEEHPDAEVTVLHVIDTRQSTYAIEGGLSESVQQARQRIAERMIAEAERRAQDHGRTVETVIEEGNAGDVIVEYAAENDVDHVIMGSHDRDRSRLSRVFVGHVAEVVIHGSPVPVTIVR